MSDTTPAPEPGAVAGRFYVAKTTAFAYNPDHIAVELNAVCRGEHNREWASATPSGSIQMTITNPSAAAWFRDRLGKEVALRFTDAPADA
jgi:hypothetical protein